MEYRFSTPSARVLRTIGAVAGLALFLAACRLLAPIGRDTATLVIDSSPSTPVYVITSRNFAITFDEDGEMVPHLFQVDSGWVQVPYQRDHDLRATGMFYARASAAEDTTAQVTMRVLIDGKEQWAQTAVLERAGHQYFFVQ